MFQEIIILDFGILHVQEFRHPFQANSYVLASNMKPLLLYYLEDESLKQSVVEMREVEEKIRNIAAHQMTSITRENMSRLLGKKVTEEGIFRHLRRLIAASGIKADQAAWDSYDAMNEYLVGKC